MLTWAWRHRIEDVYTMCEALPEGWVFVINMDFINHDQPDEIAWQICGKIWKYANCSLHPENVAIPYVSIKAGTPYSTRRNLRVRRSANHEETGRASRLLLIQSILTDRRMCHITTATHCQYVVTNFANIDYALPEAAWSAYNYRDERQSVTGNGRMGGRPYSSAATTTPWEKIILC